VLRLVPGGVIIRRARDRIAEQLVCRDEPLERFEPALLAPQIGVTRLDPLAVLLLYLQQGSVRGDAEERVRVGFILHGHVSVLLRIPGTLG